MDESAIREETNASTENEYQCPNWAKGLEVKLKTVVEPLSSPKSYIYKVPDLLFNLKEEAYIPQIISIGPFHHGNKKLQSMENYKVRYLHTFMQRAHINMEKLASTIKDSEEIMVRECYAEAIPFDRDTLKQIILVDAIFIIELFLRTWSEELWTGDDHKVLKPWLTSRMKLDFILLENQIPFFIIKKLYELLVVPGVNSPYPTLLKLTLEYFKSLNPQDFKCTDLKIEIMHFVDLLRKLYLPPQSTDEESTDEVPKEMHSPESPPKEPPISTQVVREMYCASELAAAGLRFERQSSSKCPLDLKYNKGVLEIPSFTLDDATEIYARNLMALEQCHYPDAAYISDYIYMLDLLIDTDRDVDLLVRRGIIVKGLGDSNATFVNKLCTNISYSAMNPVYVSICQDLKKFYKNPLNKMKATLKDNYFLTPCMGASTIAAVILLVLTLIQTAGTVVPDLFM